MPASALPPGFDNSQSGDWNFFPFKYIRPSWTAFGPRCTEWWAKWRSLPVDLLAIKIGGLWRYEATDGSWQDFGPHLFGYLSAIQYWNKASIQIQWPFFFAIHWYFSEVPSYPNRPVNEKVFFFRIGARRNADGFYDFPSTALGLHWS